MISYLKQYAVETITETAKKDDFHVTQQTTNKDGSIETSSGEMEMNVNVIELVTGVIVVADVEELDEET